MEMKDLFEKVMQKSINMALATSVDNKPNVRVVTFAYDPARAGKVFFTTFNRNQKVKEFAENPYVACMPIPESPEADAQVRIFGTVQKSSVSLDEIIAIIAKKYPGNADTIKEGGSMMDIYEICFDEAYVTAGMNPAEKVNV
ncbi:pyridoxamine 5'-phosphate oxidase family protein [Ohessyouella blattaphilus]|uniref:Pyridoxamine 5'-phosphate oxidase family protein n=1 Tax=Ohessyouella blattaphilus TaxID=2949333 RepID=A0ABT1EG54_9FIRM|nr:pyridoxamine 5'-phosphate oxidase family protein [Ohessyouella blattaphilus]MCP1109679.1 pyridoxamine 5'-phosphate oxidase family protein [Ohessyouella blattaphilus]MCR8563073.1 pyridoxamine 5'-phosphate oxidase family protein [Ohessyouella blattaphilus]